MKLILSCTVVLIVILTGISSQAQEPLTLYDNFESKYLDPDLWFGSVETFTGGWVLESGRQIKTEPTYGYKGLTLLHRGYGSTDSDSGRATMRNRLYFSDGTKITTIQAKVQAKKVQVIGCTANPDPTYVEAHIGGLFFNTGTPTPGSALNDVFAAVSLIRLSDSTESLNVLEVIGYALHCTSANCSTYTWIGDTGESLGTALVGQRVKLRITWDQANHRFVFQRGKTPEVYLPYDSVSFPDTSPPGSSFGGYKRLNVTDYVANCTSQPRPVGFIEVYFDDVYVNQSAAP